MASALAWAKEKSVTAFNSFFFQSAPRFAPASMAPVLHPLKTKLRFNSLRYQRMFAELLSSCRLPRKEILFLVETFEEEVVSPVQDLVITLNNGMASNSIKSEYFLALAISRRLQEIEESVLRHVQTVKKSMSFTGDQVVEANEDICVDIIGKIDWNRRDLGRGNPISVQGAVIGEQQDSDTNK